MFSIIFPGQGSQFVGMIKEFYDNFDYVKNYFTQADDILKKISKIILEGPKQELDQTENTQPAIFLASYSIFKVLEKEINFKVNNAKFFAGHSLGEYTALCCSGAINFDQTISLLKDRGISMQSAVPKGEGGMMAVLGANIDEVNKMLNNIDENLICYVANDNSIGQIVLSGRNKSLDVFGSELKKKLNLLNYQ